MKSIYKLLIDIGPLAVFFIFYTRSGLKDAILPLMIATVISVIISYILEKKIPIMPTLGAAIVLIFGGLTIYFDNEIFIKMKPTIINLVFAIISKQSGKSIQDATKEWYLVALNRGSIF